LIEIVFFYFASFFGFEKILSFQGLFRITVYRTMIACRVVDLGPFGSDTFSRVRGKNHSVPVFTVLLPFTGIVQIAVFLKFLFLGSWDRVRRGGRWRA
jgi:hypothetical protein